MNLAQAIAYGENVGVRYYVMTTGGTIYAGCETKKQAEETKRRYESDPHYNKTFMGKKLYFMIKEIKNH